jgi:pimeloyl-ACP methyl ester carboxylesterase
MYARVLVDAIPSARLELLEGAGHEIFTDRENDAARAVIEFFSDVSRSDAVEVEVNKF